MQTTQLRRRRLHLRPRGPASRLTMWLTLMLLAAITPAGAAKMVVTMWTTHDFESRYGNVDAVLWGPFEKQSPDIDIQWQRIPAQENFKEKLLVAAAGGTLPDIMAVDGVDVPAWAEAGVIAPLDRIISERVKNDYWPATRNEMTWKGELYGIGLEANSHLLFYNADLFDEMGLGGPPTHWEDLVRLGAKVRRDTDGDGKVDLYPLSMPLGASGYEVWFYSAKLWQNGGAILSEENQRLVLAEPPSADAMQFWGDLVHKYHYIPLPGEAPKDFARGGIAMMESGPFEFGSLPKRNPSLRWQVAPTPWPASGQRVSGVGGWLFAMRPDPPHPEAVARVMNYLASEPFVRLLSQTYGIPVRMSVARSIPDMQKPPWSVAVEQMLYGKARPRLARWPEMERLIGSALQGIMRDGRIAREALGDAVRQIRGAGLAQ